MIKALLTFINQVEGNGHGSKMDKKIPFLSCLYIAIFIVWGEKCKFNFDIFRILFLLIIYSFFSFIYLDTYKMIINENGIKIDSLFKKSMYIPISDIYKIGIKNHSYQIAKVYILFVYTSDQVYELPTHLFNKKS